MWTALTNQNLLQEEIQGKLKSGNACCHWVHNFYYQFRSKKYKYSCTVYRNMISPAVVCGYKTVLLKMREKCRLMVIWDYGVVEHMWVWEGEVSGEWRKLHNEELNDLYCSLIIIWVTKWRRMRWAVHVACMGRGNLHKDFFFWGKPVIKNHL